MEYIKCAIIDDELAAVNRLEMLLDKIKTIDVIYKSTDPDSFVDTILDKKPDMIFLDIEMPRITGFDIIDDLKVKNFLPKFIFITGYNQYAIKAIKNSAFDYILKPVDIDDLKACINRYNKQFGLKNSIVLDDFTLCESLTKRENEILQLSCMGLPIKQISSKLKISDRTVEKHRSNLIEKTGSRNLIEVIAYAYKNALASIYL